MKLKKISFRVLMAIVMVMTIGLFQGVKAVTDLSAAPLYFGIVNVRSSGMGYAIGNPKENGTTGMGANIWEIAQYESQTSEGPINVNAYCIKAGVGFSDVKERDEYNIGYDMKSEKDKILELNSPVLTSVINGGHYNELMAIADLLYLPGTTTANQREKLLIDAECDYVGGEEVPLLITDDDIKAVQQAAIWYFTNYGEEEGKYDKTDDTNWLNYTTSEDGTYQTLASYKRNDTNEGLIRNSQAENLYNYLINTAKANAASYADGTAISTTTLTLYTARTDLENTQPIVIVERELGKFDLALRKYITKVTTDGVTEELNATNTRVPNIDESTLTGEVGKTTATYKHRKDPVIVKTESVVTYKLTIYNEGEIAGRALKVVDVLPAGLEFNRVVSGNFEKDNETSSNNVITLKRIDGNNDNLKPYSNGKLEEYSETIEIECTVTATADTINDKVLTNVAYIADTCDELDRRGETAVDRDSQPSTVPDTSNLSTYKGNTSNIDVTPANPDYFYKGQQDDDDFEKLVIKPIPVEPEKPFDLKLLKRITAVNGEPVRERLVGVDISKLASGEDTTATYKMTKDPVSVKKGDLVTYTFRVYNEGEVDGYASEITEDIPDGLEFIWSEKVGEELQNDTTFTDKEKEAISYNQERWVSSADLKTISTDYLAKGEGADIITPNSNLIKAFNKSAAYSGEGENKNPDYKEVSVILKVVAEDSEKGIIRNEAAITDCTDSEGNSVTDRDSDNTQEGWEKKPNTENKYYDDTTNWPVYDQDDEDYDNIIVQDFDLALRKFITKIENKDITSRIPEVEYDSENNKITYVHDKTPLLVKQADIVTYTIRVYNEGDIAGYASQITDDIPQGLKFLPDNELNEQMRWKMIDSEGNETTDVTKAVKITTDYLSKEQGNEIDSIDPETGLNANDNLLHAYKKDGNPEYKDVKVAFEVIEPNTSDKIIINSAQISNDTDASGDPIDDKDSITDEWNNGEDDQDQEFLELQYFDLALRKFITKIENKDVTTRIPEVKYNAETNEITYEHDKTPLEVFEGNTVIYTIRVYNEGDIAGYASEITDDIPEGLEFLPNNQTNKTMRWKMIDSEGNETTDVTKAEKITTDYLSKEQSTDNLLEAFDKEVEITDTNPEHKDVQVAFKVIEPSTSERVIINSAQISQDTDENGDPIDDKDSIPGEWNEGEDDQDKEYIRLKYFDLALRKFITKVGNEDVTTRIPTIKYDKENNKITYEHTKEPVNVVTGDIVTYTIRVFNEGTIAGYAKEVTDDIPEGLEFLPNNELNKTMRWKMIDSDGEETTDVTKAEKITTDYLSKEQEEEANSNLIQAFDKEEDISEENPDYKDVQVAFKVIQPNTNENIIINSAQISDDSDKNGDPVDDIDSTPGEWNEGEDDQDKENIKLNYFDLALRKWVTQAIVIENGKETVTQTGHTPEMNPEPVIKVELHRKKLSNVTVKFKYSIRVTNEGDIAGYAKEITDYVPEGLKFVAEDNKGWADEGNNVISTRLLENKLLQPGEHADVEVVLTWINGQDNMGQKTNIAEISEDYNDKNVPDKDSTPDNKKPGEDDIDDAPVLLSIQTGQARIYYTLILTILVTVAGGIVLIKKFVL